MTVDDLVTPTRLAAFAVLVLFLLVGTTVWAVLVVDPLVGVLSLCLLVAVLVFVRRLSGGDESADDDHEDGSVWDAIPAWQYTGRHVESGGLTRDEQERALKEIQEQAEERAEHGESTPPDR